MNSTANFVSSAAGAINAAANPMAIPSLVPASKEPFQDCVSEGSNGLSDELCELLHAVKKAEAFLRDALDEVTAQKIVAQDARRRQRARADELKQQRQALIAEQRRLNQSVRAACTDARKVANELHELEKGTQEIEDLREAQQRLERENSRLRQDLAREQATAQCLRTANTELRQSQRRSSSMSMSAPEPDDGTTSASSMSFRDAALNGRRSLLVDNPVSGHEVGNEPVKIVVNEIKMTTNMPPKSEPPLSFLVKEEQEGEESATFPFEAGDESPDSAKLPELPGSTGRMLLSGGDDATLRIWDLDSSSCLMVLEGHKDSIRALVTDWQGSLALSASDDNSLRLWDLKNGQCLEVLEGHKDWVCAVSTDWSQMRALSGSRDMTLRLWALPSGNSPGGCLGILEGHSDTVWTVSVDWASMQALSGSSDRRIRLWDLANQNCVREFEGHSDAVRGVFADWVHHQVLSCSTDTSLRLWNIECGSCNQVFEGHAEAVLCVSADFEQRQALSGACDLCIRHWDLSTGACIACLISHTGWILSLSVDWAQRVAASGSADMRIRLWDLDSAVCIQCLSGHKDCVTALEIGG